MVDLPTTEIIEPFFLGDITVVVNLQVVRIRMQQLLSFPMLCMQK